MVVGGVVGLGLPETVYRPLPQTFSDAEGSLCAALVDQVKIQGKRLECLT